MAVSVFGELLITAGLVLGLFVVYSLWWTNVLADREADKQGDQVRDSWADDSGPGALDTKDGIGFLHVPAMNNGEVLVKKGTAAEDPQRRRRRLLHRPGQVGAARWDKKGNFTLAAHRDGHGAKFHNIDKLEEGRPDRLRDAGHLVRLQGLRRSSPRPRSTTSRSCGRSRRSRARRRPGRYITLTTCTPVYTSGTATSCGASWSGWRRSTRTVRRRRNCGSCLAGFLHLGMFHVKQPVSRETSQ